MSLKYLFPLHFSIVFHLDSVFLLKQGNYLQSAGYFIKAFSVSQSEGSDRILINASRVQYGISVGHRMLPRFIKHLDQDSLPCWERLLDWKEYKKNEFDKPIPDKRKASETMHQQIGFYTKNSSCIYLSLVF